MIIPAFECAPSTINSLHILFLTSSFQERGRNNMEKLFHLSYKNMTCLSDVKPSNTYILS